MADIPTTIKQAEVYVIFRNQRLKEHVTYTLLSVFVASFIVLVISIFCMKAYVTYVTGALDAILAPTAYIMCNHFFSSKAAAKLDEKKLNTPN